MKRNILLIIMLLGAANLFAQSYQQAVMELNSEIPNGIDCVYEASVSIKMTDGFHCKPRQLNSARFSIDIFGVYPPESGVTGGMTPYAQDGVVGALPGKLNVNDLGAAVYNITIITPEGIGKMTPEIAVTYNNQMGNGLLGWGWDLSGLSSITRLGQTIYHDGAQTAVNFVDDRFMMDGKRLMLCGGNYGSNGAVYKTEVDEMSKIVSYSDGYSGPARFVVHKKDGTVWEYGCTEDSRVEPQKKNNVALKWLVNKITDSDDNYMTFSYLESQNTGESYIDKIDYTLNDAAGIQSMYRMEFIYDDKEDSEVFYVYENIVQQKKLLKNIIVRNMLTGTVLYDYAFDYFAPDNYYSDVKYMYHRLRSIELTAGDMKLNPTLISWNKKTHYPNDFLSYSLNKNKFNKVPFVGDFNGDGYSDVLTVPYKTNNTYPTNIQASIIINKGDGSFYDNTFYTFNFENTLEWVYVVDFDGDGLDDVVPLYVNYDPNGDWKTKFYVYLNKGNTFTFIGEYVGTRYFALYPGDFFGNRKISFFLNYNNDNFPNNYYPLVVYYDVDNNSIITQSLGAPSYTYTPRQVYVGDINGDGCSEIMYLTDNSLVAAKLKFNYNHYDFYHLFADYNFDKDDYLFPTDFNGDGNMDLLKYDNQNYWKIAYSDGHKFKTPVSCLNTNLFYGLTLAPQDRYTYSLKNLSTPSVTIRTADFDGDGKTDVGVFKNTGGNYYLEIGFKFHQKPNNNYDFEYEKRFYLGINHAHQYVHLGNFLGHENISVLSSVKTNPGIYEIPKIVSLNPHLSKYSVERITDGMGNSQGFKYEYLMPGNEFYTYDYQWVNNAIRTMSLSMTALCADTVYASNLKPNVTKYLYENAMYHSKGHGLLGFQKIETKLFVNNTLAETTVVETDAETMGNNCMVLPATLEKYNYANQIVYKEQYCYSKWSCSKNTKVVMPLQTVKKTIKYDPDTPGSVLKSIIKNIDYQSDISDVKYSDVINISRFVEGTDANYAGDDAMACNHRTETDYVYNNDVSDWIVSRLQSMTISKHYGDEECVGSCEIFEYDGSRPYQMTRKTSLPNVNMNFADPLKIVADYAYDAVGHVVMQALTSPTTKNQRVKLINYGENYNYRYPTTVVNENGWEENLSYDNDYGSLQSLVDYNNYETTSASDPFKITSEKSSPDGTKTIQAKRWAKENQHAPTDAAYYKWEQTTGGAENMKIFNKNDQELRDVTFGMNGEAVYVDMTYDDYGNLSSKSMPYIAGDNPRFVYYVYDRNNRIIEEVYPNGLVKSYSYNRLQRIVNTVSPEGVSHIVIESDNPMGWLIQTVDIGGNIINYEYYSDGKLKSSMIGDDIRTKVEYEYDNRRNLMMMNDPACGEVRYAYNAFGELVQKTSAKHCVTTYNYDNLGNMLERFEYDESGQNVVATQWVYNNSKGKIGMLSKVIYGNSHSISYYYDDLLRAVSVEESVNGNDYRTFFTYDKASRKDIITYPSGLAVKKKYSKTGFYKSMINFEDGAVLWQTDEANAMGYATDYQYGNGVRMRNDYDVNTNLLTSIYTTADNSVYQNMVYSYDGFGNLVNRTRLNGNHLCESFVYDDFNRLVEVRLNDNVSGWMEYDEYGNILSKYIDYQDVYYDAHYDEPCPYAVSKVKTDLDDEPFFKHSISYTPFGKMRAISSGSNSLTIDYGYDHNRIRSVASSGGKIKEKVYVSDCEFVKDQGRSDVYTFLKGPMGVFAVCHTDETGLSEFLYVHKDNLNSWCMITDENGKIVQKTGYDVWGNPRNETTWTGAYYGNLLCDRGFTGHEHLMPFRIINMNGRVYDPLLSMMINPDENIQTPDFSQNYNRYLYCFNNPLSYNDPTGEWVEWLLHGVFTGIANVAFNWEDINNFGEGVLSFGAGFVSGCLTEGLSGTPWAVQVIGSAAGGTIKSGVNSFVRQNTGSGIDWNILKTSDFQDDVLHALGSKLTSALLNAYFEQPTDNHKGKSLGTMLFGNNGEQKIFDIAIGNIVGNIFSGRDVLDGYYLNHNGNSELSLFLNCLVSSAGDGFEFSGSSDALGNFFDKVLNFNASGNIKEAGDGLNTCFSRFRALFVKNDG